MMRWLAVLSIALVTKPVAGAGVRPPLSGVYGNVRYIAEADDDVGEEIAIHADDAHPWVEITICEGACNSLSRASAVIEGNRVSFNYVEEIVSCPSGDIGKRYSRMTAMIKGNRLYLTSSGDLSFGPEKLKRLKARNGLATARSAEELRAEQASRESRRC